MSRTREQEVVYRCAIYDATDIATKLLQERGMPDSALLDLVGWVLCVVRDLAAQDGVTLTEEQLSERVIAALRSAEAFYDTID